MHGFGYNEQWALIAWNYIGGKDGLHHGTGNVLTLALAGLINIINEHGVN